MAINLSLCDFSQRVQKPKKSVIASGLKNRVASMRSTYSRQHKSTPYQMLALSILRNA